MMLRRIIEGRFRVVLWSLFALLAPATHALPLAYITSAHFGPDGVVTVVDLATNSTVATLPVPYAYAVTVAPNGKTVYISGTTGVTPIDTATNTPGQPFGNITSIVGLAVTPDSKRIYVSYPPTGQVVAFDTTTFAAIASVQFDVNANPLGLAVGAGGKSVYVALQTGIAVIDTTTNRLKTTIPYQLGGGTAFELTASPDGSKVYFGVDSGAVGVIDTTSNTIVNFINTQPNDPIMGIAVAPDGSVVYAGNFSSKDLSVSYLGSGSVLYIPLPGEPAGVSITPDGKYVYIAIQDLSEVAILSTANNTLLPTTLAVGRNPAAFGNFIGPGIAGQTITFGAAPSLTAGQSGSISAIASSGQAVTFSSLTTTVCTVSGSTVSALHEGNCIVEAKTAGNASFLPGEETQTIAVTALPPLVPLTGYWWNPAEPGRGYMIEVQGTTMLAAGFLYADSGEATWVYAQQQLALPGIYSGPLASYSGGQTLTGAYKPTAATVQLGPDTFTFTSNTAGVIHWPGGLVPIVRYDFGPGGAAGVQPVTNPQSGWWFNPAEGGRGFGIEVQGGQMSLAGYMYDAAGNATWYLAAGAMSSATLFQGVWQAYGGGQTLLGAFKPSSIVTQNAGSVTLQFNDTANATLTLPDGRQVSLTRYRFGN
jgi:DNA-binding beta-propeller fold protein YncE